MKHSKILATIALDLMRNKNIKPNYSDIDFKLVLIIFSSAMADKIYDVAVADEMSEEDYIKMKISYANELRKLVYTYTGIDTESKVL